jgi:hypothetical protein
MAFINQNKDVYNRNKQIYDAHITNEEQYMQKSSNPPTAIPQSMPNTMPNPTLSQ